MNNIIITGATGMLGANLAKVALDNDCNVLCIVRPNSVKEAYIPKHPNINIVYSDISRYNEIKIDGTYDVFYHFAWEKTFGQSRDDVYAQLNNVQYTMDAIKLAKKAGCSMFIGAGSQAEYGPVTSRLRGDTNVNPLSGYGIAKYAAGKLGGLLCDQLGISHKWVRILSVYGQYDNSYTLISYIIDTLKKGERPQLTNCEQIWDYLNEEDAARAFYALGDSKSTRKSYALGSGQGMPLKDYVDIICSVIAPDIVPEYGVKEYYPNQPMFLVADTTELTEDTGWKPTVNFRQGIQKIAQNSK